MKILEKDDKETQVKMKLFEKVEVVTNKGDTHERLELRQNKSLAAEIIAFIDTFLFKLIFHRNDLQHHRSTIHNLVNNSQKHQSTWTWTWQKILLFQSESPHSRCIGIRSR
jgi:hypothetical protein